MLDDKYRIERLLATGGMGAVYLGTHVGLRKRVAIKVLNPQLTSAPMIERFHREAIMASQIGHEGIAQVTDLGTSGEGEPFLVMEYLEGESLASRLKASGPLAIEVACELGCAILSPLAAAHRAGIVHRDLKPDNVFLVRQSRGEMVKLLDFGISRSAGQDSSFRLTTTGLILGTPYYMSPEQARGDSEVSVAADLYSFGVMLYEMLVGVVPIRAENYNQLIYRVMTGEFTWPRQLRPDLPEELDHIVVRAMSLAPEGRPSSTGELEHALMPFCRQGFRDAASGRLSAPGLAFRSSGAPPGAPVGSVGGSLERDKPETERNQPSSPQAMAPGPAPAGSQRGVAATSGVTATDTRRKSRTAAIVAATAIAVAGVAIGVAVFADRGDSPTAAAPATTTPATPATGTRAAAPPVAPAAHDGAGTATPPPQRADAPSDDAPSAHATITLRLAIEPAGAAITLDDERVTGPELVVPRDGKPHHLRIAAPGYLPDDETVSFDESQRLVVRLVRATVPGRGKVRKDRPTERHERIETQSPYDH